MPTSKTPGVLGTRQPGPVRLTSRTAQLLALLCLTLLTLLGSSQSSIAGSNGTQLLPDYFLRRWGPAATPAPTPAPAPVPVSVSASAPESLDRLHRPDGALLVPEHFLRRWDPVTVFFDSDTGPPGAGAEDHPEKFVTLQPAHPGAYTWLDRRTLQFRPAIAWPPMGRFRWTVQNKTAELVTLMAAPLASLPAAGSSGLSPVETITLSFSEPLAVADLAQMVQIEVRPLPGVGAVQSRILDAHDFTILSQERAGPNAPSTYVLALHAPIGWGMRGIIHLRMTPDAQPGRDEEQISFSTAEPFHIVRFGCQDIALPSFAEGGDHGRDRALTCASDNQTVQVTFSDQPAPLGPLEIRNLVRFSPQVEELSGRVVGNSLQLTGRFRADTLYQVRLEPAALKDNKGRALVMPAASQLYLSFPARPGFIDWQQADGIAERFGPQMVPVKARGTERVDLRIHAIDPLAEALWPLDQRHTNIIEGTRPPAPGEEPDYDRYVSTENVLATFGSPLVSTLVDLPAGSGDVTSRFGLDLRPHLAHAAGAGKPGHYLVGIRRLNGKPERKWMRLQVTDLSLTAVDEKDQVRFAVTSLATGLPVAGARISLDVSKDGQRRLTEIASATTGADGMALIDASPALRKVGSVQRVRVQKEDDLLVLSPHHHPPREYAEGGWRDRNVEEDYYERTHWLAWMGRDLSKRETPEKTLCHLFTERPIYRPDDAVHIKGYVRHYQNGLLDLRKVAGTLVVEGPDNAKWRWPLEVNEAGSFYHKFDDATVATGQYKAYIQLNTSGSDAEAEDSGSDGEDGAAASAENGSDGDSTAVNACHIVRFKKEAYRLPRFEVQMHTPASVGLDAPFTLGMSAEYFAGGQVAQRPLHWRVTQVPFTWLPKPQPGFVFSVDQRFSGTQSFRSSPVLNRDEKTDEHGGAKLTLDPTIEPTAQPRKYLVEATVVGDDDQTVTNSAEVLALPSFVLGIKAPRYIERGDKIEPEIVVQDAQGKALPGQTVTVRVLRRQWNSILQASDFTQGQAKYITEVIEDKQAEIQFVSGTDIRKLSFPIHGAAVYVIEVESQDKLGRLQTVKVDLFAGGERPATWSRPPAEIFTVTPDKDGYAAGETAKLVLQSPFQTGQALAIVEEPDGHNLYAWVPVSKGYGSFSLLVKPEYLPRLPVHFVLMRGRLKGDDSAVPLHADLRKPATLAATEWITVTPAQNIVKVDLSYPRKTLPGQEVDLTVRLTDFQGKPLAGEVTLWLVDQAVLALAKEARLDPLPNFIVRRPSRMTLRDTRNMAFGALPLQEEPGGDEGDDGSPLLRATVRKNFTPVPYYNPALKVGPEGTITVRVRLPDSLTNFKIRAKAVSGDSRFGYGTGEISVRLPVIVQPALPRFVRPGDSFDLSGIGRLVEGDGGPGKVQVQLNGLRLLGPDQQALTWTVNRPARFDFPVEVPLPTADSGADTPPGQGRVHVTMAVERSSDAARDAFAIDIPVQPDRLPVTERQSLPLLPGQMVVLPEPKMAVRAGSLRRDVLIAGQEVVSLAGGLDALRTYPFGCAEQRISLARADLAALRFGTALAGETGKDHATRTVQETQTWIAATLDASGLLPYWPGGEGRVTVTAWALQFLTEVQAAGLPVNMELQKKLIDALKQALRSDYRGFIDGAAWSERVWALSALTAAGQGDSAYAAELVRKSEFLNAESLAQVTWALSQTPSSVPEDVLATLRAGLWKNIVIKLEHGQEVYGGLQEVRQSSPHILPSETRTLAQILRAVQASAPQDRRSRLLVDALLRLGQGNGWGSTNANSEAMLALGDQLAPEKKAGKTEAVATSAEGTAPAAGSPAAAPDEYHLTLEQGGQSRPLSLAGTLAALRPALNGSGGQIRLLDGPARPLSVLSQNRYLPDADGGHAAAQAQGLVVEREMIVLDAGGTVARRIRLDQPGQDITLPVGTVVEDHALVINPEDHVHVAVMLPLAAGMEALNPALATAPPEARPSEAPTLKPSYVAFLDDKILYFYDFLPKGTYHLRVRLQAGTAGRFLQPPAQAQGMYNEALSGNSAGAVLRITRPAP